MLQEDEPKNRWLAASAAKAIVFKERNEINKQSNSDSNALESAKKRADGKDFTRSEISDERDRRSNRATNHNHYDDENDRRHNRTSTLNLFDDNNDRKIVSNFSSNSKSFRWLSNAATSPKNPSYNTKLQRCLKAKVFKKKYQILRGITTDTVTLTIVFIDLINLYVFFSQNPRI